MLESSNTKRVIFNKKGDQTLFLNMVKITTCLRDIDIAKLCNISIRSLTDWKKGNTRMSLNALGVLTNLSKINPPLHKVIGEQDHLKEAAKRGGKATIEKYGRVPVNESERNKRWKLWWKSKGIHKENKILKRLAIKSPKKSTTLAEFVGIMIGDGGIQERQVRISLNKETDSEYSEFVVKLMKELFAVTPKIYTRKNSRGIDITVSRTELVEFLFQLGLKKGNKLYQDVDIPSWITNSKKYSNACLRGMVDTDGSIFFETHIINNKTYSYPRLNFTSASGKLILQVYKILKGAGLNPTIRRNGRSLQLEKLEEICKYFKTVGTSNQKHLKKMQK